MLAGAPSDSKNTSSSKHQPHSSFGSNERMIKWRGMEVLRGVLVGRLVAAAHVTTLQANAQVHPARASPQAVLAAKGAGLDLPYVPRGQMGIIIPLARSCVQDRVRHRSPEQ